MHDTSSSNSRLMAALGNLHMHDHPCLIYETRSEMVAAVAPFLKEGLARNERCLIFVPETNRKALLHELGAAGIDTAEALTRGALFIPDVHGIYGRDEPFDADRVFDFLRKAIEDAKADGYAGFRLVGDMPWTLEGTSGTGPLIEYEARLNDFIRSHGLSALCIYDRKRFPPEVLQDVLRTHPKVIYGNAISRSQHYLPPHEFFRTERAGTEVDNLLRGMLSNEELFAVLEERLALLNAVVENSPDIIYVKDLEGRYQMINPAGASFFGKTEEEVRGRTVSEFLSKKDAAAVIEADKKTFASGQPLSTELTYTTAGGTRTFLVIKGVYRNARGEVAGLFGISRDITERKLAEAEIADYQEELRFMATEMSRVEEQERHSIAATLHDQIGQTLALAKVKLQTMAWTDNLREEVNQVCGLLDNAIAHTRSLTIELSPPILYELGFAAAAQSLCEEFQQRYGIEIKFADSGNTQPLSEELRILLYQGLRELLVNIVKHARASIASVTIEGDAACIRLTVEDNGTGFDSSENNIRADQQHGFGLFSLRERLKYLDCGFDVVSVPGRGTRVTLIAPLRPGSG